MGRGLVRNFHTRCLYQKSHSLAALARSISDTSPTRAKIPYAPPAHEVISMFYSTFYKTKLLSRILTLVNFSSERDKTLFSGGTRRKAWDTLPPLPPDYFQINRRPPGIRTFLRSRHFTPPPYVKVRMIWAPYYRIFGFVFSGSRFYIHFSRKSFNSKRLP